MAILPSAVTAITTVGREGTPPGSNVASPFSQYYSPDNTRIEATQGEAGAIYTIASGYDGGDYRELLVDSSGRPISLISDGTDTLAINTGGSIKIGDGTTDLAINTGGSINTISGPTIATSNTTQAGNLAAAASENTDLSPGAGIVGYVESIGFFIAAPDTWSSGAASSGSHQLTITRTTGAALISARIALLRAPFSEPLVVYANVLMNDTQVVDAGSTTAIGADAGLAAAAIRGQVFDATNQLRLTYTNNTDVTALNGDSEAIRYYTVVYRKEYVG